MIRYVPQFGTVLIDLDHLGSPVSEKASFVTAFYAVKIATKRYLALQIWTVCYFLFCFVSFSISLVCCIRMQPDPIYSHTLTFFVLLFKSSYFSTVLLKHTLTFLITHLVILLHFYSNTHLLFLFFYSSPVALVGSFCLKDDAEDETVISLLC